MKIVTALLLAALAAMTSQPQATFDSGIAQVHEYGNRSGRPIVLIPGLACGPWVWDKQISALSGRYDVYALTLPGFDGRPMVGVDRLMQRAVDSVHTLIATRHLHRPIVVGHSLGGTNIVTVEGGYPEAPTQAQRNAAVARSTAPYEHVSQPQLAQALRNNMLQYTITRPADVRRATMLAWVAHAKDGKAIEISPSRHFVMIDRPRTFESALESAISR